MRWLQKVFLIGLHGILFDYPIEVASSFIKFFLIFATQLRKIIAL